MLACLIYLVRFDPDLAEFDALAKARDVKGLMTHVGPGIKESTFAFLTRPGAFGTGSQGWHAYPLDDPSGGKKFIVFGTQLTTQDYGEFVFELEGDKLTKFEDERDNRGYRVLNYEFTMGFEPQNKRVNIQ